MKEKLSFQTNENESTRTNGEILWCALSNTGILSVVLLFSVLYLPFVNKAFHIDDYAFISMGWMIGWNPLHAVPMNYDYSGQVLPNLLPFEITHPLLVPYFIKTVTALFGEKEVALHIAFMVFPLIAIFSLLKLNSVLFPGSKRIAMILAVFFCSQPAFLVNAQNIMADVPTLAFLLLALAGYFDGFVNGSRRMIYLGGVSLTLALFTSYQMLAFVVLIFLYALWQRKLSVHVALSLTIPVLSLLIWQLTVYALYDTIPVFQHHMATLTSKFIAILACFGAAMIWIVPLHYALNKRIGRFLSMFLPLLLVCYPVTYSLNAYPLSTNLLLSALVALGLVTIATLVLPVWQLRRDGGKEQKHKIFLLFWLFCVLGYCLVLLPHCTARYLLPAFPPALMLIMNDPAWSFNSRMRRISISCAICGTVLFGLASAFSDYTYANTYRDFAGKMKEFRAKGNNAFDVWYVGEWGMHYYMDKAGARYLHIDSNEPKEGDYIVIPEMPAVWNPSVLVKRRPDLIAEQPYKSWLPLKLFNQRSYAGFYGQGWGMLPFAFSFEPDEVFLLYKVVR